MIKLGVFDLDGTLLDSESRLPETFEQDMERLRSRRVSVAVASARPAPFLVDLFDHCPDILISGEDGNIFFRGRRLLEIRYVSRDLVDRVAAIAKEREDIAYGCTGPDETYVSEENLKRLVQWGQGQFMPKAPKELDETAKVCKIHVLCRDGAATAEQMVSCVFKELRKYGDVRESGNGWIGITEKDSNKAGAVRFFQKYLNLTDDETAVFGDSANDIPMFELTRHSYAMKNAPAYVREKANHVTEEDNDHNGAMKALLCLALKDEEQ